VARFRASTGVCGGLVLLSLAAIDCRATSAADPLEAAAGHYVIERGSEIDFMVAQIGGGGIRGRFPDFSGTFDIMAHDFSKSRVDFTISPASVAANQPRITNFLKSSAVFDAADFPVIRFRSFRVERTGPESARIDGMLTAKGRTLTQSFTASLVDLDGGGIAFHVVGSVYRAAYGMEIGVPIYSNVVRFDMMLKGHRS